jgi:Polysaccharide lyase
MPAPAVATVTPRTASLDDGTFSGFDSTNALNGNLVAVTSPSYSGAGSAHATYTGAGRNGYSRGLWKVWWQEGDDVWYGAAYYLPHGFKASMQGQVDLLRWDNWPTDPITTEKSGVVIWGYDKRARLVRIKQDVEEVALGDAFDLPEGRWFRLEVHQRLSTTDPLNEVYLDGRRVASSTERNFYGSPVARLRVGLVAIAGGSQRNPLELSFDEATISSGPQGGGGPSPALAEFESGSCADGFGGETSCGLFNGLLKPLIGIAASGSRFAAASYDGGGSYGHARGQSTVSWMPGDDVTYGAYFRLPPGFAASVQRSAHLLRWDNYGSMPSGIEMGGVELSGSDGKAYLFRAKSGSDHSSLGAGFPLPEGRWFHLQVRQRFSGSDPVSEAFLDGELVASSQEPNAYGNPIDRLRYGLVSVNAQAVPLALDVDSVWAR